MGYLQVGPDWRVGLCPWRVFFSPASRLFPPLTSLLSCGGHLSSAIRFLCNALTQLSLSNETIQTWIKVSETQSQSKLFLLKVDLYQVFCHRDGKLPNIAMEFWVYSWIAALDLFLRTWTWAWTSNTNTTLESVLGLWTGPGQCELWVGTQAWMWKLGLARVRHLYWALNVNSSLQGTWVWI